MKGAKPMFRVLPIVFFTQIANLHKHSKTHFLKSHVFCHWLSYINFKPQLPSFRHVACIKSHLKVKFTLEIRVPIFFSKVWQPTLRVMSLFMCICVFVYECVLVCFEWKSCGKYSRVPGNSINENGNKK